MVPKKYKGVIKYQQLKFPYLNCNVFEKLIY